MGSNPSTSTKQMSQLGPLCLHLEILVARTSTPKDLVLNSPGEMRELTKGHKDDDAGNRCRKSRSVQCDDSHCVFVCVHVQVYMLCSQGQILFSFLHY